MEPKSQEQLIRSYSEEQLLDAIKNQSASHTRLDLFFLLDALANKGGKVELTVGDLSTTLGGLTNEELAALEANDGDFALESIRLIAQEKQSRGLRPLVWYYASQDKQLGPLTKVELIELAQSGAITKNSLVWREGMPDWVLAADSHRLFSKPQTEEPSPPPPAFKASSAANATTEQSQNPPAANVKKQGPGGALIAAGVMCFISVPLWLIAALFLALANSYSSELQETKAIFAILIAFIFIPAGIGILLVKRWGFFLSLLLVGSGLLVSLLEIFSSYDQGAWVFLLFFEIIVLTLILTAVKRFT